MFPDVKFPIALEWGCLDDINHGCSSSPSPSPTALKILKISAVTRGYFRTEERKCVLVDMSSFVESEMPNMIFPDKLIRVRFKSNMLPS